MDSPSVPAAPDPRAVADAQGTINADAARLTTTLNRADQVTPWGSLTWSTQGPVSGGGSTSPTTTRTFDQAGYDAAMTAYNQQSGGGSGYSAGGWRPMAGSATTQAQIDDWLARNPSATQEEMQQVASNYGVQWVAPTTVSSAPVAPDREQFYRTTTTGGGDAGVTPGDRWTSTLTMNPEIKALIDAQIAQKGKLTQAGNAAADRTNQMLTSGINYDALPGRADPESLRNYMASKFSPGLSSAIVDQRGLAQSQGQNATDASNRLTTHLAQPFNYNGAPVMPEADAATRQRVEDALYSRHTSRLDPQFQQLEGQNRSILMNRGITENSDAWRREMDNLNRGRNDAYSTARWDSIAKGGEEMQRLFGMGLAARQQGVGEANYLRDQPGKEAALTQGLASQSLSDLTKLYGTEMSQQDAINRGTVDAYNLVGQARSNALSEEERKRAQVLNELNAIMTGSQVQTPQFQATPSGAAVNPANYAGAVQNQYQGELAGYNAEVGSNNAMLGTLGSLGAAALMSPVGTFARLSDRRLKKNIVRLGALPNGLSWYKFDYLWGESSEGVMADEVRQVRPDAVISLPSGFDAVNYSALGA